MEVKIREFVAEDIDDLVKLEGMIIEEHQKYNSIYKPDKYALNVWREYISTFFESEQNIIFIAKDNEKTVGFVEGNIVEEIPIFENKIKGKISTAFVLEEYRRKGILKKLVRELLKWFKGKVDYIELNVDIRNDAVDVWRSLGFEDFQIKMIKH